MKSIINLTLITFLSLFVFISCENYSGLIPTEYNTILSLKKYGEQSIRMYTVEKSRLYDFTIMKNGHDPKAIADVELKILSEDDLAEYSQLIGRTYKKVPESCYKVVNPKISFASSDTYKIASIELNAEEMQEKLDNDLNYVIPIHLVSGMDSVNSQKDLLLLIPEIIVPKVLFKTIKSNFDISNDNNVYELKLVLSEESLWDFSCKVSINSEYVHTEFDLVDILNVSLANDGIVEFSKGEVESNPLLVTINNQELLGKVECLPLKILSTSMENMEYDSRTFELLIKYNKILIDSEMLSTNAQEKNEGPIINLIDNDPSTFFHSSYSESISDAHFFQINLKEPIKNCMFEYQNRNNTNGKPKHIRVDVSTNGKDWMVLDDIDEDLPLTAGSIYSSKIYNYSQYFSYLRFTVLATNGGNAPTFFSLAEFNIFGK